MDSNSRSLAFTDIGVEIYSRDMYNIVLLHAYYKSMA